MDWYMYENAFKKVHKLSDGIFHKTDPFVLIINAATIRSGGGSATAGAAAATAPSSVMPSNETT